MYSTLVKYILIKCIPILFNNTKVNKVYRVMEGINMSKAIPMYVECLKMGKPQAYKNMVVTPLLGTGSKLDYLVLDEALQKGLNVKETGNVGALQFQNNTGMEVLILQGEYFKGGYQNRMVARNIYMAKDFEGKVPVNCVQAGRWSTSVPKNFEGSGCRVSPKVYSSAVMGQSAVWDRVRGISMSLDSFSNTQDYDEVSSKKINDVKDYSNKFTCPNNAVGIVVAVQNNGTPEYVADIFSSHKTLKKNFQKLINASALEAAISGDKISDLDVKKFLQNIETAQYESRTPISLGKDYRITSSEIEGSGLVFDELPLYINISTKEQKSDPNPSDIIFGHTRYDTRTDFRRTRFGF